MAEDICTIIADMNGKKSCTTRMVYQYNRGMRMLIRGADLPAAYRVEFSNGIQETSVARLGNAQGVSVPFECFIPGETILAWVVDMDAHTRITDLHIRIPISRMARAGDDEPEEEEQSFIGQTIAALNAALEEAEHLASCSGYMDFRIDERGHLIYTRTDATDVDFSIDAETGHLILEVE